MKKSNLIILSSFFLIFASFGISNFLLLFISAPILILGIYSHFKERKSKKSSLEILGISMALASIIFGVAFGLASEMFRGLTQEGGMVFLVLFPAAGISIIIGVIFYLIGGIITRFKNKGETENAIENTQTEYIKVTKTKAIIIIFILFLILCFTWSHIFLFKLATLFKNEYACSFIPAVSKNFIYEKEECFEEVAVLKKDYKICEKIKKTDNIGEHYNVNYLSCYRRVGFYSEDKNICSKIGQVQGLKSLGHEENPANYIDYCYYNVAKYRKDSSLCAQIISLSFRNSCYFDVANYKNDSSICSQITGNEKLRNSCFLQY